MNHREGNQDDRNEGEPPSQRRDEDLLPISALQHLAFCERQCALIHVEREWEENRLTAEGRTLHERVDEGYREYRRGLKQFAGVYVRSLELGIYGRLDVLELTKIGETPNTCPFLDIAGNWELCPVEFKRGKPKTHEADRIQVCAQALCLEEMTGTPVRCGALFYGAIRRRDPVEFTPQLRSLTQRMIQRLQEIIIQKLLPPPVLKRHCRACSLIGVCQPKLTDGTRTQAYRKELLG